MSNFEKLLNYKNKNVNIFANAILTFKDSQGFYSRLFRSICEQDDIELNNLISSNVSIPVIASGGAGTMEHFLDAFRYGKADAVLAASLFHFREIEIAELKKYLRDNGESVRI